MNQKSYLDAATAELQKRAVRKKRRSYLLFMAFYLLNVFSLLADVFGKFADGNAAFACILMGFVVIGIGIMIIYQITRSQKFANIATLIYVVVVSAFRFSVVADGVFRYGKKPNAESLYEQVCKDYEVVIRGLEQLDQ